MTFWAGLGAGARDNAASNGEFRSRGGGFGGGNIGADNDGDRIDAGRGRARGEGDAGAGAMNRGARATFVGFAPLQGGVEATARRLCSAAEIDFESCTVGEPHGDVGVLEVPDRETMNQLTRMDGWTVAQINPRRYDAIAAAVERLVQDGIVDLREFEGKSQGVKLSFQDSMWSALLAANRVAERTGQQVRQVLLGGNGISKVFQPIFKRLFPNGECVLEGGPSVAAAAGGAAPAPVAYETIPRRMTYPDRDHGLVMPRPGRLDPLLVSRMRDTGLHSVWRDLQGFLRTPAVQFTVPQVYAVNAVMSVLPDRNLLEADPGPFMWGYRGALELGSRWPTMQEPLVGDPVRIGDRYMVVVASSLSPGGAGHAPVLVIRTVTVELGASPLIVSDHADFVDLDGWAT